MHKTIKILYLALLVSTVSYGTESKTGARNEISLQHGIIAVVSEGYLEPRSAGSYSLRIYKVHDFKFPYDNFVVGMIRPRDGGVANVEAHDIDGDAVAEVIVIVRNAGSGGYLSADAFKYKDRDLSLIASVNGLAQDEDPLQSLMIFRNKISNKFNPARCAAKAAAD